jgi:hypothetical protein
MEAAMPEGTLQERRQLQAAYARAIGLKNAAPSTGIVPGSLASDVNGIVDLLSAVLGDDARSFAITPPDIWRGGGGGTYATAEVIQSKLGQMISYLEYMFNISEAYIIRLRIKN